MRGWRRRFEERAEEIRVQFTELAHEWDSEQAAIEARASPELDALEAIGVAVRAAVRRFGPEPVPLRPPQSPPHLKPAGHPMSKPLAGILPAGP